MRTLADIATIMAMMNCALVMSRISSCHMWPNRLLAVYKALAAADLGTANIGLISDIIACPGLDYCGLATARSIPVAQQIAKHFQQKEREFDIGPLKVKISGCINACGHHHVGHIGILGLDRAGVENYRSRLAVLEMSMLPLVSAPDQAFRRTDFRGD